MNIDALERKLLQAARNHPPGDQVPYAFEQRILARLQTVRPADPLAFWSRMLWRAALSSLAITLLVGAWTVFTPAPTTTFADDFEQTVLAGLNEINDTR